MLGAIIGDIVGSRFEFMNTRTRDFNLFSNECSFTDDTVCTVAVADAILKGRPYKDSLVDWCRKYPYPMGGYGARFSQWVRDGGNGVYKYESYGNGAAMRVSPIGWAFNSMGEVLENAKLSAECSHGHLEAVKGAQVVAETIRLCRVENNVESSIQAIENTRHTFYRDAVVPKRGVWDETCQGCVPLALDLVAESSGFEDAIRNAIAYGGDSDTLGAIVGSIAEAVWGIDKELKNKAIGYLTKDLRSVVNEFEQKYVF